MGVACGCPVPMVRWRERGLAADQKRAQCRSPGWTELVLVLAVVNAAPEGCRSRIPGSQMPGWTSMSGLPRFPAVWQSRGKRRADRTAETDTRRIKDVFVHRRTKAWAETGGRPKERQREDLARRAINSGRPSRLTTCSSAGAGRGTTALPCAPAIEPHWLGT